jgi:hypothetical protein
MSAPSWNPRASAENNGDFIHVETYSGYRLALADPMAKEYYLEADAADEALGKAALDALAQSRALTLEQSTQLRATSEERYEKWVKSVMAKYGYKTRRALFKNMKSCGIECCEGRITIRPSNHEKLEGWSGDGISKQDHVVIPADSAPEEVGAALRLAFSRCIG